MLNELEREVVVLKAVLELIDSIVNREVLTLSEPDPCEVQFQSSTHAKFFNIVLVDLLSATDKKGLIPAEPYIAALRRITDNPSFDVNGSIADLRDTVQRFVLWLNAPITIEKVWLPRVWIETNLTLTRLELVKTAGNICRHNFLRATGIAQDVIKMLGNNGVPIALDKALLVLADLYQWLHTDVFYYHSSRLAEFLNDIQKWLRKSEQRYKWKLRV